jgi:effector-binding domain-containing protein
VVALHTGPYEDLPAAREALKAWLREKGKSASYPIWEEYLTNPHEEPDPSCWETRLCQPIF